MELPKSTKYQDSRGSCVRRDGDEGVEGTGRGEGGGEEGGRGRAGTRKRVGRYTIDKVFINPSSVKNTASR